MYRSSSLAILLMFTASIGEANYNFTIRFYEFRNPLGLQCSACDSGGEPACCDEQGTVNNCRNDRTYNCDTRLRFLLRPFGASVETAPNTRFPYFTHSNGNNSKVFNEGPGAVWALPNPFTITSTAAWTGRIQFYIDAVDRAVPMNTSGFDETLAIINRFPINLEMTPGTNFTERTTYTGFYNVSGVGFDMSFKVQCSENYYGPNCTCKPLEGVYTCNIEGKPECLQDKSLDSSTNCTTCLNGRYLDPTNGCSTCLSGRGFNPLSNCTQCLHGFDPNSNCTTCLPNFIPSGINYSERVERTTGTVMIECIEAERALSMFAPSIGEILGGAGGGLTAIVLLLVVPFLCIAIVICHKRKRVNNTTGSDTTRCHNVVNSSSFTKKSASSGYPYYDTITPRHDDQFDMIQNPIYELASQCNKYNQYVQASNNKHVQGST